MPHASFSKPMRIALTKTKEGSALNYLTKGNADNFQSAWTTLKFIANYKDQNIVVPQKLTTLITSHTSHLQYFNCQHY